MYRGAPCQRATCTAGVSQRESYLIGVLANWHNEARSPFLVPHAHALSFHSFPPLSFLVPPLVVSGCCSQHQRIAQQRLLIRITQEEMGTWAGIRRSKDGLELFWRNGSLTQGYAALMCSAFGMGMYLFLRRTILWNGGRE